MKRFLCWWTMENDGKLPLVIVGLASNHQQSKGIGGILEDSNSAKVAIWTISIQLSVRLWSRNSNSERSIQIFLRKTIAAQLTQTKNLFSAFLSIVRLTMSTHRRGSRRMQSEPETALLVLSPLSSDGTGF